MIPYAEFQTKMTTLIEYSLTKELELDSFHNMQDEDIKEANRTHKCGTHACLVGYAPEVWPEEFTWVNEIDGVRHKESKRKSTDIVFDIAEVHIGDDTIDLEPMLHLFSSSSHTSASDYEVARYRLNAIQRATSYEDLIEHIIEANASRLLERYGWF